MAALNKYILSTSVETRNDLQVNLFYRKVILIHGFNKNSRDMKALGNNLKKLGHDVLLVDLPLTFKEIEYSIPVLEEFVAKLNLRDAEKINLVGHSTGGVVIRSFLANSKHVSSINRCVLIATPNSGSELADLSAKLPAITGIFRTLKSLQAENVLKIKLPEQPQIEIGAIAGNKNNLTLGNFLTHANDGRVTVSSVKYEGLKDFVVLPYGHKEIHYQYRTALLINNFLSTGKF